MSSSYKLLCFLGYVCGLRTQTISHLLMYLKKDSEKKTEEKRVRGEMREKNVMRRKKEGNRRVRGRKKKLR